MTEIRNPLPEVKPYKLLAEETNWIEEFNSDFDAWAALYYALTLNTLDFSWFEPLLSPVVTYESQSIIEKLSGIKAVSQYLTGKIEALKQSGANAKVLAELGTTPDTGLPCVILYQAQGENDLNWRSRPIAYVLLKIIKQKVESIFIVTVAPNPKQAKKSEIFPSAKLDEKSVELYKLPPDSELEFLVFLLDGKMNLDKLMIETVDILTRRFPNNRTQIIKGLGDSQEDYDECVKRNINGFPVLIIQYKSKQLLRFDGIHSAENLIKSIQNLF